VTDKAKQIQRLVSQNFFRARFS